MTVRLYQQGREIIVAACDKDILGRTLREGEVRLNVSRDFYEGEDADEELLVNRLKLCTVANLVGEKVCAIAAKHEFISMDGVLMIQGVPHAQMIKW